ncbi:Golgi reassembly stacking protein grasp65, contains pdz domain, partial [Globisporangium splendens]
MQTASPYSSFASFDYLNTFIARCLTPWQSLCASSMQKSDYRHKSTTEMGNESSTLAHDDAGDGHHRPRRASSAEGAELEAAYCGFRVLGIQEQSPASRVGFVSFFDFILEANGIRLDTKDSTLMELIAQSEEHPMQLTVYNVKAQTTRGAVALHALVFPCQLELTPSREWPGKGLLGVTIRFDSYEGAEDQLLHVLNVVPKSPADRAGLKPETDYLLGTPERVFRDPEDLQDEILEALEDTFQCYVYNTELDQVRIVSIAPSEYWGGDGVLGAEVAHGVLHRLPTSTRHTIGSSVGFVNLSKDAKAATDAFMKRSRPLTESESNTAVVDGTSEAKDDAAQDQQEGSIAAGRQQATGVEDSSSALQDQANEAVQQDAKTQESPSVDAPDNDRKQHEATPEQPSPPAPSPPQKPRYTARTDMRFPMSTVEVYVDPYQLS